MDASPETKQQTGIALWELETVGGRATFTGVSSSGQSLGRWNAISLGAETVEINQSVPNRVAIRLTRDGKISSEGRLNESSKKMLLALASDIASGIVPQGCIGTTIAMFGICAVALAEPTFLGELACVAAYISYVEDCGAS